MLRMRILLAIVLLLSCGMSYSQQPPPRPFDGQYQQSPSTKGYRNPSEYQRGTENNPVFIKSIESEKNPERTVQEAEERNVKAANERSIVVWTIALSCATIALAVITGFLAFFTLKLWRSTGALVREAEDTSRRQLRAYVFVDSVSIINVVNPIQIPGNPQIIPTDASITHPSDGPMAYLTIKNSGQTPAYDVVSWGAMVVREYPLISNLPPKQTTIFSTKSSIAPRGITTKWIKLPVPLTEDAIASLRAGTHAIYIYGDISYRDAFKIDRITNFRFMYGVFTGAIGVTTDVTICEEGNNAT